MVNGKSYALSAADIQRILEPDTKIFTYPAFSSMTSIDEAFDPLGRCVSVRRTESANATCTNNVKPHHLLRWV